MSISSPSSCALLSTKPRASSPPTSTSLHLKLSSAPFSLPIRSPIARRCPCLVLCSSTVRTVAEMVEDKPSTSPAVATSSAASENNEQLGVHSRTFLDIRTEQDLLLGIQKELEAGRLPLNIAQSMEELYQNYRNAVFQSGHPQANDIVLSNMGFTLDRIFLDVKDPYDFSPYHEAIREPFDYYTFGQNYIRPLIDFRNSYVGNLDIFYEIEEKLKQGENVILISNHQTEADPAVLALLLEARIPLISESTTYVAGDRVVTDPLCKPFSKGRNLLCVYSKKHMNDDPELVEMKKRANTRSLKEMATLLRGGSMLIWISPSGGRDRPDPVTNEWFPSVVLKAFAAKKEGQSLESQFKAPFEASAVDNMRRLVVHAGIPGHIYPLALLCHDIMPPPAQVEKEIGEKRLIGFHGTGISVAPSISYNEITAACGDPEEAKVTYSRALCDSANEQYDVLKNAIHGKKGLEASTPAVSLSQPWV